MRDHRFHYTYSLRDLFVAVAAIAVVLFLWIHSIDPPRTAAHRNLCANNMRQVSLALLNYEHAHGCFPGYSNVVGGRTTSYIVPLLPYLERRDLYDAWSDANAASAPAPVYLSLLDCPSDPPPDRTLPWLSYVVNSGEAGRENQADGICFDQTVPDAPRLSLRDVYNLDGTEYTLLLSENIQADKWTIADVAAARITTTMVWHSDKTIDPHWKINSSMVSGTHADLTYARPSSRHAGGVSVTFCDTHYRFIREDIDYAVYCRLMTPHGKLSRDPVNRRLTDDY